MPIKLFSILLLFSSSVLATPTIEHWQTSRGANVYFVESHELPIIDIQMVFDAGSSRDPDDKKGLALLTSNLLGEGAKGLDADTISYEFEKLGAVFGTNASYDSGSISLRSLSDSSKLNPALKNLKRILASPDFPEDAFQRQRRRFLIGLQQKQQSPQALARDAFYSAVFKDHPYAFPNEGTEDSLSRINRADLLRFFKQYYVSRNATIVIVGDISRRQAKKIANDLTRQLGKGEKPPILEPVAPLSQAVNIKVNHQSAQTHIMVGQPGMKRGDPDFYILYVGNHILGGGGMVSRLFTEIREKRGLSYSAYSYFVPMRDKGPFLAGLQTRAGQEQEAVDVLRENLKRFIKEGPTEEELIASKKNITGGFPLRIDSNSDILSYVAMIGFYKLPLDYLDQFNANIEAVTADQIKQVFQRRLSPEKMATVMVGPVTPAAEEIH